MLPRLVLLALQLIAAWFAAPIIVRYIPGMGRLELFVYAVVFAVLVWLVGVIGSQVLKETAMPSSAAAKSSCGSDPRTYVAGPPTGTPQLNLSAFGFGVGAVVTAIV